MRRRLQIIDCSKGFFCTRQKALLELKTQELRFYVWAELSGFQAHSNSDHHPRVLELIEGILKEMVEAIADTGKLVSQYGFETLESDSVDFNAVPRKTTDRLRWALRDKKALSELIDDLREFNDGLLAAMSAWEQRTARFNATTRLASSVSAIEDLQAIQDGAQDSDVLSRTAAFKILNLSFESPANTGSGSVSSHEISMNDLAFIQEQAEVFRSLAVVGSLTVLVEWKPYHHGTGKSSSGIPATMSIQRIGRLVTLLMSPTKPKDFQTLECVGYTNDKFHSRVGIVFIIPGWNYLSGSASVPEQLVMPWITLENLMGKRPKLPLLGHRISLALTLTKSMIHMHATGWYHKGYQSNNIVFIADSSDQSYDAVDIREPKVAGFDYSRPRSNQEASGDLEKFLVEHHEAYVPPEYLEYLMRGHSSERNDVERFKPRYDMFALGCVLLEVGLWRRMKDLWALYSSSKKKRGWIDQLLFKYVPDLGGRCGERYQRVVTQLIIQSGSSRQSPELPLTYSEIIHLLECIRT